MVVRVVTVVVVVVDMVVVVTVVVEVDVHALHARGQLRRMSTSWHAFVGSAPHTGSSSLPWHRGLVSVLVEVVVVIQ